MNGLATLCRVASAALLVMTMSGAPLSAQTSAVPLPAPVQSAPLPAPASPAQTPPAPSSPAPVEAPPATLTPSPSPVPSPVPLPPTTAQGGVDPNAVLAGRKGDAALVEDVTLSPKTALVLSGQATWEQGFETLQGVFAQLAQAALRQGVAVAGRPVTYFVETDDMSFRYEAMLPVERAPADAALLGSVRVGVTPAGKALRFVHIGPYDDIDSVYEGITAYLDAKGITVRDQFLEEYVNDAKDRADAASEINIYVMPR